jgi:hypothetical protein
MIFSDKYKENPIRMNETYGLEHFINRKEFFNRAYINVKGYCHEIFCSFNNKITFPSPNRHF